MKKIILVANHSVIEPLGLMHLSTIAKQEKYDPKIMLVKNNNFSEVYGTISSHRPDFIGIQTFTGNHVQSYRFLDEAKRLGVKTIIGGPHPTYYPQESMQHADYVVISEGFNSLRRILRGEADEGIVELRRQEPFPLPDRETFYKDNEEHRDNLIKSIITGTGCPYSCTYCYNGSSLSILEKLLSAEQMNNMRSALGNSKRLFVKSKRSVDDILKEIENIKAISPRTKMIYFQDDVFGSNIEWLREFERKYNKSFPYHAQLRFEYANPNKHSGRERLKLMKNSGCTGLTFAIESANSIVRKEVLNRMTEQDLFFESMKYISNLDFKVRTEQMLGLPLGATNKETPINLEADLETLKLNVELKRQAGLPNLAWTSIFTPYPGTKISEYCERYGFAREAQKDKFPDSFFQESVLNFPNKWHGEELSSENECQWLPSEEQGQYKQHLLFLKKLFSTFAQIPRGDELAREFLLQKEVTFTKLDEIAKRHLFEKVIYQIK